MKEYTIQTGSYTTVGSSFFHIPLTIQYLGMISQDTFAIAALLPEAFAILGNNMCPVYYPITRKSITFGKSVFTVKEVTSELITLCIDEG